MSDLQIWKGEPESEPEPKWVEILQLLDNDYRYEMPRGTLRLWKEKLKRYPDEIICEAILRGNWLVHPNVNEVIKEIKMIEDERREDRINRDWERYKARQKAAEEQGLMATDADYAEINATLKKIANSKPIPKIQKPPENYTPPPPDELNRRKQEQLKAVFEKYGKGGQ